MPRMSDGPSGRGGARNRYIEKQKRPEESNGVRAHNKHIVLNERRGERERERKKTIDRQPKELNSNNISSSNGSNLFSWITVSMALDNLKLYDAMMRELTVQLYQLKTI